jgi:hypothetical protein
VEFPRRSIAREPEFEEQLARLIPNEEEADEFTAAAEYVLAVDPREGLPASRDGLIWSLPMQPVRGRGVSLFYTFDDRVVVFLAILAADE